MAHDEYQIPAYYTEQEARADVESITANPVETEAAPYQRIKDIENTVFSYRDAALAMEKQPNKWLRHFVTTGRGETLEGLIDKESAYGGALFGAGHKFWLDNKSSTTVFRNEVADWYHLQQNPADPKNPIVLRFQTTPQSIHKLYNGVEYSLTIEDLEHFIAATEAYTRAILPLYPLDQTLNELQQDSNKDGESRAA